MFLEFSVNRVCIQWVLQKLLNMFGASCQPVAPACVQFKHIYFPKYKTYTDISFPFSFIQKMACVSAYVRPALHCGSVLSLTLILAILASTENWPCLHTGILLVQQSAVSQLQFSHCVQRTKFTYYVCVFIAVRRWSRECENNFMCSYALSASALCTTLRGTLNTSTAQHTHIRMNNTKKVLASSPL